MPCRKPCNRYTNVDDVYEGAVPVYMETKMESYEYEPTVESFEGAYEPSVSRESYAYEPTVESFKKNNGQMKQMNQMNQANVRKQNQVNALQKKEKRINTVQACNCHCQPQLYVKESYSDPMESENCGCGPMNRAYRVEHCGYNQSPSWQFHRANMTNNNNAQGMIKENMQPGMENACGCSMVPYYNENCGNYNKSQTWSDQQMFRENVLNKY
jgi:hypothetical protein